MNLINQQFVLYNHFSYIKILIITLKTFNVFDEIKNNYTIHFS
ncbi:hypothetical protein A1OE_613 [Candidatus Endolissoclinum faulkneri L2]|uniref:Uncharacterized protein n=1 Tax=Candidatus Endolissoclinum faulkneri L2 TaxID=1193729 RepID=K7ZCQ2_9PROT|nr:hypothetical protein A1OE_613 [Candidatus Endolissoclinum faulkneri L2]